MTNSAPSTPEAAPRMPSGSTGSTSPSPRNGNVATLPDELDPVAVHPDQEVLFDAPLLMRTPDFARRAGATYRQVDYWCRTGLLRPVKAAHGSGSQRVFDAREVRVARAIQVLLGRPGTCGAPGRREDLVGLLDSVRNGQQLGLIRIERGVYIDLDELTADPE